MRTTLAVGLLGAGAVAAACAPASSPPTFAYQQNARFIVQVVQATQDSGRSPLVALDAKGNPAVSYLLALPVPKPGVLPEVIVPGTPQPPSVMLATASANVWTRIAVTGQRAIGKAQGLAPEIADENGYALPGVVTSLALDGQGKHHVAWSTPKGGVYYADDTSGQFGQKETITTDQAFGASIAVAPDGTPWVAYLRGITLDVASRIGGSWHIQDVTNIGGAPGVPSVRTAIRVGSDGNPVVAYGDNGRTAVARRSGTTWATEPVPGGGGYGVSLALDKDGNPHVAYYDTTGGVHRATSTGAAAWDVLTLGSTAPSSPGPGDRRWGTGIAVDDQGAEHVAWADTKANDVMLATAKSGGTSTAQAVPSSQAGWTPSVAVTPDGRTVAIAWFDSVNLDLDLAMPATGGLALARPTPTNQQPSSAPTSAASCSPNGTSLQITAPNGASASGFDTTCLAAPANTAVTVAFQNQDSTLHNFEIFTDSSATTRVGGASGLTDLVAPGTSATYKIDPLKPGSYFYRCDVHPAVMTGTFVVAAR